VGVGCLVGVGMDGGGVCGGALLGAAVGAALWLGRADFEAFVAAGWLECRDCVPPAVPVRTGPGVLPPGTAGPLDARLGVPGALSGEAGDVGAVAGALRPPVPPAGSLGAGGVCPATAEPVNGPARATVTTPVAATARAAVPAVAASTSRRPRSRRRPALERRG
jgi:hypothetical protein